MSSTPNRFAINGHPRIPNGVNGGPHRASSMTRVASGLGAESEAKDDDHEDDPIYAALQQRWQHTEASIAALFGGDGQPRRASSKPADAAPTETGAPADAKTTSAPPKKAARQIDDDYGDDEDDEDEEEDLDKQSPLKSKGQAALPNGLSPNHLRAPAPAVKPPAAIRTTSSAVSDPAKSSEDVRKQLEEDKKAAAEAAKLSFQSMFYTYENDRDAMLEQQKLDELDREVENELSTGQNGNANATSATAGAAAGQNTTQGSLGSADLGASSLTLKHLISRIDMKRDMVKASDNQLRTLISEVRKGRSKWASEDRVGQEELYEAAEKVLMELKAMTEYAQPFLQRVSKREAPDYFQIIKTPMDIGTMIKKLKQFNYKSKKDFVDDLNLIWANCLKYNQDPAHPLRKKALYMRKETDKLTPLIPDIVVRDRAEVEAEERRLHSVDADDSDDDDAPLMASRGRKAPKKGTTSSARKAPPVAVEDTTTPVPEDRKPAMHPSASNLRNDFLRADSEAHDANSTGLNTPPPGLATPLGVNGVHGSGAPGSQADVMEVDGFGQSAASAMAEDPDEDDTEFKTWKQVTKKDRAQAAAERNRLFNGSRHPYLNEDEPALLRSKAMMRKWIRQQKMLTEKPNVEGDTQEGAESTEQPAGESLAEGIEKDEDSTLPDYYNPLSAIPDLDERWKWTTDSEGYVVSQNEEGMRMFPKDRYKTPQGSLANKMETNMHQMQETRKICAKIGIVKQMQIQAQTYQNQFQKYEPQPFLEQDVGPVVVSEEGPLMAPWVNRAAFQRSVGKIFYHAGFEDFQPSALDVVTDVASEFLAKLGQGLMLYHEQPKKEAEAPRFTFEEQVLHTLDENGMDIESLETYIKDDVERLSNKLGVMHERMKSHLADLLRPALGDHAGADGVGAFNDGSEQFVGGDFAEDLDEDFFGFKELGLADELGLESLSVPLHLLQNRMHSAYQAQNQGPVPTSGLIFTPPEPYEPITTESIGNQIGLVQDFFRNKLRANRDEPLVEDEDLPQKQRFPKPRLPPTGKISSPRKRPLKEQQQAAKKKRKLEESEEKTKTLKPLHLQMPDAQENGVDPEKDAEANAPMSPESIGN
ncbi:hypothetical protein M409DRAFT_66659 [Zasmidium cellare ATCC 36951]|uniref:SAGA complex subunit Spt7 n=1 Tax=Zasmidium cellare ATCC 36951 TaxID=1080233 RepID=A0A6A6CJJ7_ZASCE|nr:uncharacterized protein M409DRAFT_66659 [Zasmidium cellare ATCC 36951]KAF2166132.1 hypothetical protein M409DRAFT_66659 [Zasmidium cellare ATCC 36951]